MLITSHYEDRFIYSKCSLRLPNFICVMNEWRATSASNHSAQSANLETHKENDICYKDENVAVVVDAVAVNFNILEPKIVEFYIKRYPHFVA